MRRLLAAVLLVALALPLSGCSIRGMATRQLANALSGTGDVFSSDDDPDLVGDALPFALKTMEIVLAEQPGHRGLLVSACSGFTQYAYAFVEAEAQRIEWDDYRGARRGYERALRLYLRGRDYCLRGLEATVAGSRDRLPGDPVTVAAEFGAGELELLYWTGASWGAAISVGKNRPELTVDLPVVRALVERALELNESWEGGALHDTMIALNSVPEAMGGSPDRAREHLARSLELSNGRRVAPHVTYALGVAVTAQDRETFVDHLERALEIDPDAVPRWRLANLVGQRRAQDLLDHVDDLFLE